MRFIAIALLCLPLHVTAQPAPPMAEIDARVAALFAGFGCVLPADLVDVYRVFVLDQILEDAELGVDRAYDLLAALDGRAPFIDPNAPAMLEAARAVDARALAGLEDGRLELRLGMISAADCEPEGTIFTLSPYDRP